MKSFISHIRQLNSLFVFGMFSLLAAIVLVGIWPDSERRARDVVTVSSGSGDKVEVRFRLDEMTQIPGTDTQMMKLTASRKPANAVYGDYEQDTRNVLFLTGEDNVSRWVFPDQDKVIHEATLLFPHAEKVEQAANKPAAKAIYFVYSVKDTTGDGKITQYDRSNLGLSSPSGEGFVTVLADIDRLYSVSMSGDQSIAVLYRTGKSLRHALYSVATLSKVADREVAAIPGVEYSD